VTQLPGFPKNGFIGHDEAVFVLYFSGRLCFFKVYKSANAAA